MLNEYIFYDIHSVKVIELNTDYSYCRKSTVIEVFISLTVTVTEKFH